MTKRIAITQRIDDLPDRNERRDSLDQRLPQMIREMGYMPLPVPNCLEKDGDTRQWLENLDIKGIILSGGNDIGQYENRDKTEQNILSWAIERKTPVLGICRGMQMIAVHYGTSLKPVEGHVRARHVLTGTINRTVNSYHNFSIETLPPSFEALAFSEDGEIEAIEHKSLPLKGWMWHPEREERYLEQDNPDLQEMAAFFNQRERA
ncbi:MAG: gamma-glutamyl-gamma-aminobutyrate hydrolase family protein [Alphaproteobacteria bacterium]|nr:gamma-glutamyl-gamma-aminobutyrate hydrolase family protein [Alphaproteobacteria bacterium]